MHSDMFEHEYCVQIPVLFEEKKKKKSSST